MTRFILTAVDTTQIQRFVFGSNKLKENIGGSELVELATHRWVYEALPSSHNVVDVNTGRLDASKTIGQVDAEVVYVGGGNAVIMFRSIDLARAFTRRLTLRVLKDAPGLDILVAHREFNWNDESLAEVMHLILRDDIARKKQARTPSLPLLGLGVTAPCNSTGLVTAGVVDKKRVSREILAKASDDIQDSASERLHGLFPRRIAEGGWDTPDNFDKLGRIKGEEGYIAVVHADGNGMGQRVEQIASQFSSPVNNREYIDKMRALSEAIGSASVRALQRVVNLMADAIVSDAELAEIHREGFPLRPIVFGGDDVTFVCNGRYGLPLAAYYLEAFQEETAKEEAFGMKPAFACAGVAVVKVHYPFARAYALSEQLCSSAKKRARAESRDCSALDWHFAMSGIAGSLEAIRKREYSIVLEGGHVGHLAMRPVLLEDSANTWRTWPVSKSLLDKFVKDDGKWYDRRNKVKALREAMRTGPAGVEDFLRTYRLDRLPAHPSINVAKYETTGWDGEHCIYFDPIEAMDFYTDLKAIVGSANEEMEYAQL